ncbi:MAG: hypothetical protein EAZ95_12460 [Bacteroidetes bacterium]|nr:MAG: hypothetical protein EAZ95_12460 [Bacteroidota bacterium]
MKVLPLFLLACLWAVLPAVAQQPTKPIDKALVKKWFDSTSVGGQISVTFNFTEAEVKGNVTTTAQKEAENAQRRQELQLILTKNPEDLQANMDLCGVAKDTAQASFYRNKCLQIIEKLLAQNPNDGDLYFKKGQVLQSAFRFSEAMQEYGKAQKLIPDSAKVYQKAGELYFFTQQYANAKEYFDYALKLDDKPLDRHFYYMMTDIFLSMMQLAQAESQGVKMQDFAPKMLQEMQYLFKAIEKYGQRADLQDFKLYARVLWVFYKGFMIGASLKENQTIDDKSIVLKNFFFLSEAERQELKELEKYFEQIIKQKKLKVASLPHEAIALVGMVFGDDKKSIQAFQKAIKLNPEKGQNYHNIAFIYSCQRNYAKAEAIIKEKMKQNQDVTDYVVWAGMVYRQKNNTRMRSVCEEGLAKYPQSPDLYVMQGMTYCYEDNYELGEKSLLKAVEASNYTQGDALYKLALAQLAQEKWGSAKIYLEKARDLKNEEATDILKNYFE